MRKKPNEVELTQYLRPNGRKRIVFAPVGKRFVKMAKDLVLSCEELTTGEIAIYARRHGEDEEDEALLLAENSDGEKNPTAVLIELIKMKADGKDDNR